VGHSARGIGRCFVEKGFARGERLAGQGMASAKRPFIRKQPHVKASAPARRAWPAEESDPTPGQHNGWFVSSEASASAAALRPDVAEGPPGIVGGLDALDPDGLLSSSSAYTPTRPPLARELSVHKIDRLDAFLVPSVKFGVMRRVRTDNAFARHGFNRWNPIAAMIWPQRRKATCCADVESENAFCDRGQTSAPRAAGEAARLRVGARTENIEARLAVGLADRPGAAAGQAHASASAFRFTSGCAMIGVRNHWAVLVDGGRRAWRRSWPRNAEPVLGRGRRWPTPRGRRRAAPWFIIVEHALHPAGSPRR